MKLYHCDFDPNFNYTKYLHLIPLQRQIKLFRYRRETDRILCAMSYLLLYKLLIAECGMQKPPALAYSKLGKPFLKDYSELHINISHCDTGCACVISSVEVGVDIQDIRPYSLDVAKKVFSEEEYLLLQNADEKQRVFAKLWSQKEAYLKMQGIGISDYRKVTDRSHISTYMYQDYVISVCGDACQSVTKINI